MTTDDLNCDEFVELVTAYLEDALDADTRARFEAHLADCTGCERYLDQLRVTIAELGRLDAAGLSDHARADLLGAFRGWRADLRIEEYDGDRDDLLGLFALAEDSQEQLDSYLGQGRILVARLGSDVVGHLQLMDTGDPTVVELKNMAVLETRQGQGIGARLVRAALDLAAAGAATTMVVATAAAGVGTLRFYQRQGFRLRSVERDAFVPATGYPAGILIDGIELRDRVWLDRTVST